MTNPRAEGIRVFLTADHLGHPGGRVYGGTTYFLNTIPMLGEVPSVLTSVDLNVVPGDLDALSDAVAELLEDPARRCSPAGRGKEHTRSFDPELHVERMVDIYSKVIDDRTT